MKGLWHVSTQALQPGVGLVVWDCLATCCLVAFTLVAVACRSPHWRAMRLFHTGMVLLCAWLVLHCIDLGIRQAGVPLSYGYIIIPCAFGVFRNLSAIFILGGYLITMKRYRGPTVKAEGYELAIGGVMWVLGLYEIGLQFCLSLVWLGFTSMETIDSIAQWRSGVDVAFAALQFSATLLLPLAIRENKKFELKHSTPESAHRVRLKRFQDGTESAYPFLFCRSLCEVVIVGQLDRWPWPSELAGDFCARDVCYSLFSVLFAAVMVFGTPSGGDEDIDPWEEEAREEARLQEAARVEAEKAQAAVDAAFESWIPEANSFVKRRLGELTAGGTKPAPSISVISDELRGTVLTSPQSSTHDIELRSRKLTEVDSFEKDLQGWKPIFKWDGGSTGNMS